MNTKSIFGRGDLLIGACVVRRHHHVCLDLPPARCQTRLARGSEWLRFAPAPEAVELHTCQSVAAVRGETCGPAWMAKAARTTKICPGCGQPIEGGRVDKRFHGSTCRTRVRRGRSVVSDALCTAVDGVCVGVADEGAATRASSSSPPQPIEAATDSVQAARALGELALLLTSAAQMLAEAARTLVKAQTTQTSSLGRMR